MGSNYLTVEGSSTTSSGSSDSLNGLKFGQKIYFEDVGLGVSAKASGGSGGSSGREVAAMTPKKGRGGAAQCGQPPRCQVEGCNLDLSDSKLYYSRHKVCVMHSKSPKVIVAGIEQRFCQQCSRFHQLPEFDQGKRSCRRRLAGHNERRRKPPAGSSLSSRFGRLSPSIFDSSSRSSEFIVDFSAYARASPRSLWPATKSYDPRQLGVQPASTGKCLQNTWAGSLGDPMPDVYMQGSPSVGGFYITSGESITGVSSDSTCALSLLSNQPWLSRNRADTTMEGSPIAQLPTATSPFAVGHFPHGSSSWGFKGTEPTGGGLHDAPPELGLGQISYPLGGGGQFDGSFEVGHHNGRQYMEVEHSRVYMSTEHDVGWSL